LNSSKNNSCFKISLFIKKIKNLNGDPHYVAFGMAIGVFMGVTPTIPFNTVLAIFAAYIFKASKPAAIIGVWICNPVTVVFIYIACYKTGMFCLGYSFENTETVKVFLHGFEQDIDIYDKLIFFIEFIKTKLEFFIAIIIGGIILGFPAGVISYFITKAFMKKIHLKRNKL